ncbi:uncharacterized protein LOC142576236 [Dermacentor variabilis]|uniref:uncharacterized protein LOC142576236 n=1 Tax=Dermacentor variabilis TaxID=34621 RepID=UPI003F5C3B03
MSKEEMTTDHGLVARATALEQEVQKLRQTPAPMPPDADYDSRFLNVYRELTVGRVPNAIPKPLLKDKILQSLRNEQESLERTLAVYTCRVKAAEEEIADLEDHSKVVAGAKNGASPVPSDYRAVKTLTSTRKKQISEYLHKFYLKPHEIAHTAAHNYLALNEILDRLLDASANPPEARYIRVGPEFWPPHVQVLLHMNLVERDPDRSDHIRLQDCG